MNGCGITSKGEDIYFPADIIRVRAVIFHARWRAIPPFLREVSQFIKLDAEMGGKLLHKFSKVF
jgi:hypothetical protein